jgi:hypothetical protein
LKPRAQLGGRAELSSAILPASRRSCSRWVVLTVLCLSSIASTFSARDSKATQRLLAGQG